MKRKSVNEIVWGVVLFFVVAILSQVSISAQDASTNARQNRIVGVWDVQVTTRNCTTGAPLITFRALHKYELGGTGQVLPALNPALFQTQLSVWSYVQANDYQQATKSFRFDAAGNNTGWGIVRNNVSINDDATEYVGSGRTEFFDSNGNILFSNCHTIVGTPFN